MKACQILSFVFFCSLGFSASAQKGCIASNIPFQVNETMYQSYNGSYYELYGTKDTPPYDYCVVLTGNSCVVKGKVRKNS
jgi:hypothetical protein